MDNNTQFSQVSQTKPSSIILEKEKEIEGYVQELKREERKRRIWIAILTLFIMFLSLSAVYGVYLVSQTTRIKSKAYETSSRIVELSNSYLFASPLKAKAGGERIRITVFILDGRGLGISGKKVVLSRNDRIQIEEVQGITDDLGKAVFDVYSASPGVYQIEAAVEDKVIPQRVLVTFE